VREQSESDCRAKLIEEGGGRGEGRSFFLPSFLSLSLSRFLPLLEEVLVRALLSVQKTILRRNWKSGKTHYFFKTEIPKFKKKNPGKELNARRSPKASSSSSGEASTSSSSSTSAISAQSSSNGGSSRGAKFRALKAKEAAKRASKQSRSGSGNGNGSDGGGGGGGESGGAIEVEASSSPSSTSTGDRPVVPDAPPSKD
jgi:hypothetical protein